MTILTDEQLKQSKQLAKDNEIRQNVKSHCTKIKQGILNNGNISGNRAIWELFQNAGDLSKCAEIEMSLNNKYFTFAHKGKSFTYDSLCSLVKQVSSEEKENDETVGQYGTGFLTTHTFGRKILLRGSMKISDMPEVYVDIDDFEINRENFADIPQFIEDMKEQIKSVEKLMDAPQKEMPREWTELQYVLTPDAVEKVKIAFEAAEKIMPFVLTFNDNIGSCVLNYPEKRVVFVKQDTQVVNDRLRCTRVFKTIGDKTKTYFCYYLELHGGVSRIILPIDGEQNVISFGDDIPKLYVHYPLIGPKSNYQNVNFLFHSHLFVPEEPRDNIIVPKGNDAIQYIAQKNVDVLNEMTRYLWDFLEDTIETWTDTINLAPLHIKTDNLEDSEMQAYYKKLKADWVEEFKKLKLFEIGDVKYNLVEMAFPRVLHIDLEGFISSARDKNYLDTIYEYVPLVGVVPEKDHLLKWSKIIAEWELEDKYFIELKEIAQKVSECPGQKLHDMLQLIVDANQNNLLAEYALIPNREGVLKKQTDIYDARSISAEWFNFLKPLIPDVCEKMVDNLYTDVVTLNVYSGKDLQAALNQRVKNEESKTWGEQKSYSGAFEESLIRLCSVFYHQSKESKRSRLMPIVCNFEDKVYEEVYLDSILHEGQVVDLFAQIFPSLVENQMKKISSKNVDWVKLNSDNLCVFIDNARGSEYDRFAYNYAIYPNANGVLHQPNVLKKNMSIDQRLFSLYEKILGKDLKEECVDCRFENFYAKYLEESHQLTSSKVALEIQSKLSEGDYQDRNVLDVIDYMECLGDDGKMWQKWFADIYKQRESIRYRLGTDKERKAINRMMKQKNPYLLEVMAEVAEQENALNLVTNCLAELRHDEHIRKLGEYVEQGVEQYLTDKLQPYGINVKNQQNGQDFILSKAGYDDYFIEIKSRWNSNDSVEMSPAQFAQAVLAADRYALIGVNMVNFDQTRTDDEDFLYVEDVLDSIYVLDSIGYLQKDLYAKTLEIFSGPFDKIYLNGTYKVRVPQSVLRGEKSKNLDEFIETLIKHFS